MTHAFLLCFHFFFLTLSIITISIIIVTVTFHDTLILTSHLTKTHTTDRQTVRLHGTAATHAFFSWKTKDAQSL